jgi:hypothetical protein
MRVVRPIAHRIEIGRGGRGPARVALRELVEADAFLAGAVDVVIVGDAHFLRGAKIGVADRQRRDRHRDAERAAVGMIVVDEPLVVLGAFEIGEDFAIAPAFAAFLSRPGVVVERIASRVNLRVDRRSAAEHLGLRVAQDAPVHMALRHGLPAPGADALGHFRKARGHVVQGMPVAAARLEQHDGDVPVLAEPVRQHAARRPGADDHVIGHPSVSP